MNLFFKPVLKVLKSMLLSLFGEKLVAYVTFSFLSWLASRTSTPIDDEVVTRWKKEYYSTPENTEYG